MTSLTTANLPSHHPPRSPDFTKDATVPCLVRLIQSPDPFETLSTAHKVFHNSVLLARHAVASHCHTHARTHKTARLPTDTLQNICEKDTIEEAEVGGDMKTVCACHS